MTSVELRSDTARRAKGDTRETRKIAVIGGGISGLGAAYLLSTNNSVTLFEAAPRLGGHARTIEAGRDEKFLVDTGFIVFNDRTYPNLTGLFHELGVVERNTNMSFSVSLDDGGFEYSTQSIGATFADKRNLLRKPFIMMLRDILRFNAQAVATSEANPNMTLNDLLDHLNMGHWFRERYLLPLSGAIWSTSTTDMLQFPARALTRFCDHHGLLSVFNHPQWKTVVNGSQAYVERIAAAISKRGATLRTSSPVEMIERQQNGVNVKCLGVDAEHFDAVVIATHSDQTLKLLSDPDRKETDCLSSVRYRPNRAVLHNDACQMPQRRSCWASWGFKGSTQATNPNISVTYWMNRLQGLPEHHPFFVTLNPTQPIPDQHIFDEHTFHHPQFDSRALTAQTKLANLNGTRNTWFCGAYARNGFHEDGLWSAVQVAKGLGADISWS